MTWQGRQLTKAVKDKTVTFTYDSEGIRTSKSDGTNTTKYLLNGNDFTMSNIFSLKGGPDSLLTTWYYPKEWNMLRVKPMFRTPDGKVFKARCILSYAHDQDLVFTHIRGIQRKYDEPILLKVKYLKYSKAILSIQMVSYPHDMKRRTKDYIDKNLSNILRWTIKV